MRCGGAAVDAEVLDGSIRQFERVTNMAELDSLFSTETSSLPPNERGSIQQNRFVPCSILFAN